MNNSWAKVVLDSVATNGRRLLSVECRYWRALHSEVMTHRDRARNAASSRAIPFYRTVSTLGPIPPGGIVLPGLAPDGGVEYVVPNCTYAMIANDPFIPEFIGTEQKGMQSGGELTEPHRSEFLACVRRGRDYMLALCLEMYRSGVHKSIINRYLEPWSYITVLMTATEWKNFFRLRVHPKAEKHFNKVAAQIKACHDTSVPTAVRSGSWHLPYVRAHECIEIARLTNDYSDAVDMLKKVSAGRCARLSYLTHDGVRDFSKDVELFDRLIRPPAEDDRDDDVIHSSPLEHVAMAHADAEHRSGPFVGWHQFRKDFPNENVPD